MNDWDKRFKDEQYIYGTAPNQFLEEYVHTFNGVQQIACYAEGEGRNAVFLAQQDFDVVAYDYSLEGLRKTAQLATANKVVVRAEHIDLLHGDVKQAAYDGAVMIFGHFQKSQQPLVLNKIMDSLKMGGRFLLEVYEESQLAYKTGGPPSIDMLYSQQFLRDWASHYNIVHFFSGEVTRHEGIGHTGTCSVVQLIVEK